MKLNDFLAILRGRYRLIAGSVVVTVAAALLISLSMPKTYTASMSLVVDFRSGDPFSVSVLPAQLQMNYMITQVDILSSERVALSVVDRLGLADESVFRDKYMESADDTAYLRHWIAEQLLQNLTVEPLRDSRVVKVGFSSRDPVLATKVVEAFTQAYIQTNLELSIEPARMRKIWFDEQLKTLRVGVENAQAELTAYQQQHRIVETDERIDTEIAKLTLLADQLVNAQAETYDAESRLRRIQASYEAGSVDNLQEVLGNSFIQTLKADVLRQETALAELSRKFGENHPQYQSALTEVQSSRAKLKQEVDALLAGFENNVQLALERQRTLEAALSEQKERVLNLRRQRDDIDVLVRETDSATRTYDAALERFSETSLESQFNQTNVAVLTMPVEPVEPSGPKTERNVFLSVFLGMLLGIGLALIVEVVDRRVRTENDLAEGLGVPVLGSIKALV